MELVPVEYAVSDPLKKALLLFLWEKRLSSMRTDVLSGKQQKKLPTYREQTTN